MIRSKTNTQTAAQHSLQFYMKAFHIHTMNTDDEKESQFKVRDLLCSQNTRFQSQVIT
jgi:hypothetical protein